MFTVTRTIKYSAPSREDLEYQLGICYVRPGKPLCASDGITRQLIYSIEEISRTEITEEADVRKDL